jgi:hypothetical protein
MAVYMIALSFFVIKAAVTIYYSYYFIIIIYRLRISLSFHGNITVTES